MLLLRKISINKWPANRDEAIATARDCLSDSAYDLRTTEGIASFWDCTDKNVIDILPFPCRARPGARSCG